MAEITLTGENFAESVLKSDKPVLVDFWATWCGPCRMIAPNVAQIAEEHTTDLVVGKVNVDEEAELAEEFGIRSIPTIILFRNGKPVAQSIGYKTTVSLKSALSETRSKQKKRGRILDGFSFFVKIRQIILLDV